MMTGRKLDADLLMSELAFTTSRSSGPGGQHVNKVSTKVTLRLDIINSMILTPEEKEILLAKLKTRLTTEGVLVLSSQDKRSQLQNKEAVMLKLEKMLEKALAKKKSRKATKPTKQSVNKRIHSKKQRSEKKKWRQKPD